ncbi:hypothetical protein N9061_00120 [bacterium]|nr:hypothetical protein [bacterium]
MKWFTFLRSPTKRFISHYIHQQTNGRHEKMDINVWASRLNRANFQVKWLAGEEDLEAAKQILNEKFSFVGFVENFDTDLKRLIADLEIPNFDSRLNSRKMVVRNPHLKRYIDENYEIFKNTIEKNNALDQQLYDYAASCFRNKFKITAESTEVDAKQFTFSENLKFQFQLGRYQWNDKFLYHTRLKLKQK